MYCTGWTNSFWFQKFMPYFITGVISTVNFLICTTLEKLAAQEKKHSTNDETMSKFLKLTLMTFINTVVTTLLVNFNFLEHPFMGIVPILNGEFSDFNAYWYGQVGKTLTFTMLLEICMPHGSKLFWPAFGLFKRCLDRGCCSHDRFSFEKRIKQKEDEGSDEKLVEVKFEVNGIE